MDDWSEGPFESDESGEHLSDAVAAMFAARRDAAGTQSGVELAESTPARLPRADRKLWTYVALTCVTFGLYPFWYIHRLAEDMNQLCEGDGEKTAGAVAFTLLSVFTCGIYTFWWYYRLGDRIQRNAPRYGFSTPDSGVSIMLFMTLGILILVGPFIGWHKIIRNVNAMAQTYRRRMGINE